MPWRSSLIIVCLIALGPGRLPAQNSKRDNQVRNDRKAFEHSKDWIYNDLAAGIRAARETGKPLMVVFRCIPCEACQAFDDDVARRDPIIRDLLDRFVCVRIVQANAMDLDHFRFDFDLSFAVLFTDADLTIYGRFGTRSGRPEEQDISLQGLRKAMAEALRMHHDAAAVKRSLAGKQVKPSRFHTPRDYPSLSDRYKAELDYAGRVAQSCIHCHQVRDAERQFYRSTGERFPEEVLYPYPDPEVVGLKLDPQEMAKVERVEPGSSAERDGFRPGDEIISLDGQPLLSIADVQWVLHNAPATAKLPARVRRGGTTIDLTMTLKEGWRRGDISWRPTTWGLRGMVLGGMKLANLRDEDRRRMGLADDRMAIKIEYLGEHGGEHGIAHRAGLSKGDVIVAVDGHDRRLTESQLIEYALWRKHRGDAVTVTILRNGSRKTLTYALP
jgi:hypothetical protein